MEAKAESEGAEMRFMEKKRKAFRKILAPHSIYHLREQPKKEAKRRAYTAH